MRTTQTIMVEKVITTSKCDFCNFSTTYNSGCCGYRPIMECDFCKKDICSSHRGELAEDDWSDYYPKLLYCNSCAVKAHEAWDKAQEIAGRHDDIFDLTMKIYRKEQDNIGFVDK